MSHSINLNYLTKSSKKMTLLQQPMKTPSTADQAFRFIVYTRARSEKLKCMSIVNRAVAVCLLYHYHDSAYLQYLENLNEMLQVLPCSILSCLTMTLGKTTIRNHPVILCNINDKQDPKKIITTTVQHVHTSLIAVYMHTPRV